MTDHVVQFSTGAGSAEVAYRVHDDAAPEDRVILLTADTLVEDADNWRFAEEVVAQLPRAEWVRLAHGRTPMEIGRDNRVVPSDRMAICSKVLKRQLLRGWIEANYEPDETVIYLGFDWTEDHRLASSIEPWRPWTIDAPLMRPPYLTKAQVLDRMRERGIEPPRLYAMGFSHANCGGACVRGGHAQWELLLRTMPERYAMWEAEERTTREVLGRDVSILTDRRGGGPRRPLTLEDFRRRLQATPSLFDADDWGACGCFGSEDSVMDVEVSPHPG